MLNEVKSLSSLKGDEWEDARDRLIAAVADYQGHRQENIYLVFDGHFLPDNPGREERCSGRMRVVFTKEGETADTWIERQAARSGGDVRLTVVTSDRLEQSFVWNQGALRLSARELWREMEKNRQGRKKNRKKEGKKFATIDERLDEKTREILEKWRRSG